MNHTISLDETLANCQRKSERRVELIHKDIGPGLTAEERQELQRLQTESNQRVAPMDRLLIAGVPELLCRA